MKTIQQIKQELALKKGCGSGNGCIKCGQVGFFGSVIRIDEKTKSTIICGWCGHVEEESHREEIDDYMDLWKKEHPVGLNIGNKRDFGKWLLKKIKDGKQ